MDISRLLVDNVDPNPLYTGLVEWSSEPSESGSSLLSSKMSADSNATKARTPGSKRGRSSHSSGNVRSPYVCEDCGASFVWKHGLRRHRLVVEMGKRDYKCEYCQRRFGERGNLVKHIRYTHLRLRPFACTVCQARFSKRDHCRRHMIVLHPHCSDTSIRQAFVPDRASGTFPTGSSEDTEEQNTSNSAPGDLSRLVAQRI